MSSLCKACAKRESNECGIGTCQVRIHRTLRAIHRHQQRLNEAQQQQRADHIERHLQAIERLQRKLA